MRVLVLGGAGMLGHVLVRQLRACSRIALQWTTRQGEDGSLSFDLERQPNRLADLLAGVDFVINGIAVLASRIDEQDAASVRRAEAVNAVFPQRLAEIAGSRGVRVIHISTDGIFAANAGRCVEETPPVPPDVYGQTKLRGEVTADHVLNIRCSLIGPDSGNGRGLLAWLVRQPRGARIAGFTDQLWTGCSTYRLALLCRGLIAESWFDTAVREGSVHHFCPIAPLSKYELLGRLTQLLRPDIEVCPVASGQPVTRRLDTDKHTLHRIIPRYAPLEAALSDLAQRTNVGSVAGIDVDVRKGHLVPTRL
jgi:dTDP-4-dehydrorhamnose reductase